MRKNLPLADGENERTFFVVGSCKSKSHRAAAAFLVATGF